MLIGKSERRIAGNGDPLTRWWKEGWPRLGRCDTGKCRFDGIQVEMRCNKFGSLVDHRFKNTTGSKVGGLNESKVP